MKCINGIWMPDGEVHMIPFLEDEAMMVDGKGTYQIKKLLETLRWCGNKRVAVDIGAHVGTWAMHLAKSFHAVWAFEPMPEHRECFVKNCAHLGNIMLIPTALGDKKARAVLSSNRESSGDTWILPGRGVALAQGREEVQIMVERLDSFPFDVIDLIKVDCEGYELYALQGAEALIVKHRPTVIVEQKPGRAEKYGLPRTQAVDYLRSLGMVLRSVMSGDYILSFDLPSEVKSEPARAVA